MIELFTSATPNGHKVSILLEELGVDYKVKPISLSKLEQKEQWFLKLNPNGRIPVIIDHDENDFVVFESGAIMHYLAKKYNRFIPVNFKQESLCMQWLMFQMGGVGPMMGQSNVFTRYAKEKIPYAINRYQKESRRLLEVLDSHLADNEYLAGEYSIADIANFSWARIYNWSGVSIDGLDHLGRWLEVIEGRSAVKKGLAVPKEDLLKKKPQTNEDFIKSARNMLT